MRTLLSLNWSKGDTMNCKPTHALSAMTHQNDSSTTAQSPPTITCTLCDSRSTEEILSCSVCLIYVHTKCFFLSLPTESRSHVMPKCFPLIINTKYFNYTCESCLDNNITNNTQINKKLNKQLDNILIKLDDHTKSIAHLNTQLTVNNSKQTNILTYAQTISKKQLKLQILN